MLVRADNVSNSVEQGKRAGEGAGRWSGDRAHGEVRRREEGECCMGETLPEEYTIQI